MAATESTSSFQRYHKIVFLGKPESQKSLLIRKILGSTSESIPESTNIEYYNIEIEHQNDVHYLQIWNLQSQIEENLSTFLRNTSSVIFVFNYKDKETQSHIQSLHEQVTSFLSGFNIIFVGLQHKEGKAKASREFTNWIKENAFSIHNVYLPKNEGVSQLIRLIIQQFKQQ